MLNYELLGHESQNIIWGQGPERKNGDNFLENQQV